ncbi:MULTISPECIES: NAD(P)/FAD-dependent oxidoreductase [Kitasatospora]|uniref:FAD-dependent oxidoreductase n=1 Tax=Kitasatospora cathayae TaxID=3004092 RepID=A0ABY7PWT9_9ACTN|nr:FAD-dependent oxidoreductase [Kitasatospora sp. HUAS 3-15]WBP84900.1 FAD-dependent oxidoreductase [Kitasatospora sp. HUAS 3-15]
MNAEPHVLVVGGGFAGLETAFGLRHLLGDGVRLSLAADREDFLFKPNTIYLPFGGAEDPLHIPLRRPLFRRHIAFHQGTVAEVDPDALAVELVDGTRLRGDFLVLATGAAMRPQEVPGLAEHARTVWTPRQMHSLGRRFQELKEAAGAGQHRRVLFLVPPGNKCAGPLYEIAFMLDTWLRRARLRPSVHLTWSTYESGYVQAFGPRLHQVVEREFAARGIEGHTSAVVEKVGHDEVRYADGSVHPYDLLVAFPPYAAAVDYHGLPRDDRGFLQTLSITRQVHGHPQVYAPGDAGDFPVKQAFLAFLQAHAVAEHITTVIDPTLLAQPRPFEPISMCVMEMLDKATFAQVPLEETGDPTCPVRVAADAGDRYRVGTSPVWRFGKKALGVYLPVRFRAGRPFHSGRPWQAMQLALDGMSRTLASGSD